ncbi:hypothetical protein HN873_034359, partial [Arachis hypogaea]
ALSLCSSGSTFIECKNLKSFSISEEEDAPQCLTFLQGFYILECPEFESFPHLGLPTPKLRRFWVSYCNMLNSLLEPVNALVGLQELTVLNLPSMQFFANEGCSKLFVNHACGVVENLL